MSVAGLNVMTDQARTAPAARQPLLSVRGVKTYYGNIIALKGVDLDVNEGETVAHECVVDAVEGRDRHFLDQGNLVPTRWRG